MAGDLGRAGQYRCRSGRSHSGRAGIPAGRAALLRGPGVHLQAGTPAGRGSFAGPGWSPAGLIDF